MTREEMRSVLAMAEGKNPVMYARQLQAALRQLLDETEWRPIETAPEGAMCLFCSMETGDVRKWAFVDWIAGGRFMLHPKWTATHWLPLPAPPTPAEGIES